MPKGVPNVKVKSIGRPDRLAVPKRARKPGYEYRWTRKTEERLSEIVDEVGYELVDDPEKPGQTLQRGDLYLVRMPKEEYDARQAALAAERGVESVARAGLNKLAEGVPADTVFGKLTVQHEGDMVSTNLKP